MGDSAEDKELNDIMLCYQAMGASIGDSPEKLERLYNEIIKQYKKDLASSDLAERTNAKASFDQVNEMYAKIKNSITYSAMTKDYLKAGERAASQDRSAQRTKVEKASLRNCPHCNKIISIAFKVCPMCKTPILTGTEKFFKLVFSRTAIVMYLVLVIVALAAAWMMFPSQLKTRLDSLGL